MVLLLGGTVTMVRAEESESGTDSGSNSGSGSSSDGGDNNNDKGGDDNTKSEDNNNDKTSEELGIQGQEQGQGQEEKKYDILPPQQPTQPIVSPGQQPTQPIVSPGEHPPIKCIKNHHGCGPYWGWPPVIIHKKVVHHSSGNDNNNTPKTSTVFVPNVGLVQPFNCQLDSNSGKLGCDFAVVKMLG